MESIYNLDSPSLCRLLETQGCPHPQTTAERVFHHLYRKRLLGPLPEGQISRKAMDFLAGHFSFERPILVLVKESPDQTVKFLLQFPDGERVETVLIPFPGRSTVCLSTQVGCAMKCSFCFTGTQGLKRQLTSGEILAQYLLVWEWLEKNRPQESAQPKIVFMGQGEPLHNFEAVKKAVKIMVSGKGMQMGVRRITLSTAGYLPGLLKWHELPPINLALSLHSPFNPVRSELIPLNRVHPLEEVLKVIDLLPRKKNQAINYEYLLLDGINNRETDAYQLAEFLRGKRGIINLIPFNQYPGSLYKRPSPDQTRSFQNLLSSLGLHVTVRGTKGSDILAACGQLKANPA